MNRLLILVAVTGCAALAGAQNSGQSKPAGTPAPPPPTQAQHPRRAQAKLEGFDLAPEKATANQIGGASRGLGTPRFVLYAPHKARIYTLRPAFAWRGDPGAEYKLHIQNFTGTFAWDRDVTGNSLAYPSDAPPLTPGDTYLWRVIPVSPLLAPPPPAAMIVVLGGAERAQLETGISQIQGTGFDADTARAHYLFDQRLWYDALMTYSELIARYPDRRSLYEMRGTLYDQLPATEPLADADFARSN